MELQNEKGEVIRLSKPLTRAGGEGQVFEIQGSSSIVAKIYHTAPSAEKIAKLRYQVQNSKADLHSVAAWPTNLLLDAQNLRSVRGVLMRRVQGKEIHRLYGPSDRQAEFPSAGWDFLIHVAMNCAAAFETLHENGAVMADVNEGNLLVKEDDGRVGLIDCDSYQIPNGNGYFLCDVGIPMWTPPELQGQNFRGLQRTVNHDRFGLAIVIFRLLFMGRHPFAGIPTGTEQFDIDEAIRRFLFAFSPNTWSRGVKAPPLALTLDSIPGRLRQLFERAFLQNSIQPNSRPTGREWAQELKGLLAAVKKGCVDPGHIFWHGLTKCPWCEIAEKGGPNFFLSVAVYNGSSGITADITIYWQEIEKVKCGALMTEKVVIPNVGLVSGRTISINRPTPSRLAFPSEPATLQDLPPPQIFPPALPQKPVRLTPKTLKFDNLEPNERLWRVSLLSGVCIAIAGVLCLELHQIPISMAAAWGSVGFFFLSMVKWSSGSQERRRRKSAERQFNESEKKRVDEEYQKLTTEFEKEVARISREHHAFVAKAEAGYRALQQKAATEHQSKLKAYEAQVKLFEQERNRFANEEAAWNTERALRQQTLESAQRGVQEAYSKLSDFVKEFQSKVNSELPTLEAAHRHFQKSKLDEVADLKNLHNKRQEVQKRQFLALQLIQNAKIPKIGDVKKATLIAYGCGSALDVRPDMSVPGFGEVLLGHLLNWRQQCESQFRYNPNVPLPPAEVRNVKMKHLQMRQSALVVVRGGAAKLTKMESDARITVTQMRISLLALARAQAQAFADFEVCK